MTHFGTTRTGHDVQTISLTAGQLSVTLLTYGAILQNIRLAGHDHSLTLGSDRLSDYEDHMIYHGALVGPVANRISTGRVRLDGMMHELERNDKGQMHLHSGSRGMHAQVWTIAARRADSATLTLALPDGATGLPGNRRITACFTLSPPATLTLDLTATTDAKTLINIANHCYWNLDGSDHWRGHRLKIAADHYTPVSPQTAPTGEIRDVTDTAFDFRSPVIMQDDLPALDHNFCLSDTCQPLRDVLWLTGAKGVRMVLATTEPGLQVYDARHTARPGRGTAEGLAIEAQHWPDAPNNPAFPPITLTPQETYRQTTQWRFDRKAQD